MELVILIGLQAAGKSTFYRTYFAPMHEHVSKDLLRNHKKPSRRQQQLVEEALQAGRSVVVDNTNASREERRELIGLAQTYAATVTGYYFETQVKQSLERNKLRAGKARVPDVAIFATLKRLERPSYQEGFTKLFYVRSIDNAFDISDWREEG